MSGRGRNSLVVSQESQAESTVLKPRMTTVVGIKRNCQPPPSFFSLSLPPKKKKFNQDIWRSFLGKILPLSSPAVPISFLFGFSPVSFREIGFPPLLPLPSTPSIYRGQKLDGFLVQRSAHFFLGQELFMGCCIKRDSWRARFQI